MTIQLNPPIPLETSKGRGYAHFMIDYSQEHDLVWVVFLDETGECWTFRNSEVRIQNNFTLGRTAEPSKIVNRMAAAMNGHNGTNGHASANGHS